MNAVPNDARSSGSTIVLVIAAVAAGILGSTQPTGATGFDVVWRVLAAFGFGAGLQAIPRSLRRLALLVLAPAVTLPVGALALGAACIATVGRISGAATPGETPTEQRDDGKPAVPGHRRDAVVSVLAIAAVFSLTDRFVPGAATIASASSFALIGFGCVAMSSRRSRRFVARLVVLPAVALGALTVLYGVQMVRHAPGLSQVAHELSRDPGDVDVREVADRLERARTTANHWYFRPLEAVPIGAQNVRASRLLLTAADDIVGAAVEVTNESSAARDAAGKTQSLTAVATDVCSGIETLARQFETPGSGFLVPPLQEALQKMEAHRDLIDRGAALCPVAPHLSTLAGLRGDRNHLVLFATTAESRGTVGLVTNWAQVSASGGTFELESSGRSVPLNERLVEQAATVTLPEGSNALWGRFELEKYFQDITLSPSAPVVADAALDLFAQAYPSHSHDGVVIVGPRAISAVVGLCGGIDIGDIELDADTTVDFLTKGQYEIDLSYGKRVEMLQTILDTLFSKIGAGACEATPGGVVGVLDAVSAGEVLYVPASEPMRADFVSTPLGGVLPAADGGDLFGVIEQNAGLDKLDAYLVRETRMTWTDRSSSQPRLELSYTNDAPAVLPEYVLGLDHGSAPPRVNRRRVSIYAPVFLSAVSFGTAGSRDREQLTFYRGFEQGHRVSTFLVDVEPGSTTEVAVEFESWNVPSDPLTVLRPPALRSGSMSVAVGTQEHNIPLERRISKIELNSCSTLSTFLSKSCL